MKKTVAIFKEDTLDFVSIELSMASAAEKISGNRRFNSSVVKYLSGEINTLKGFVVVGVDISAGITQDLIEQSRLVAKRRRDRAEIFKINNEIISLLSDDDATTIVNIIKKYTK